MKLKPDQFVKHMESYAKQLKDAKDSYVAVGLPQEKMSAKIYGNGMTVIQIGAIHEFGTGKIPERSFLALPFEVKKKELGRLIERLYNSVFEKGMSVDKALGLIGIEARNVSVDAFRTEGYGQWPDITDLTKAIKGSDRILFDNGTLRNSIAYVVRKK